MLKDLLIIRADRAKYYYGAEDAGGGGGFDHWGKRVAHGRDIYKKCVEMLRFFFSGGLKMIEQIKQLFGEYNYLGNIYGQSSMGCHRCPFCCCCLQGGVTPSYSIGWLVFL